MDKRHLLFLLGCIPLRTYFVYYVKNSSEDRLRKLSVIGLIMFMAWMIIYLTDSRKTGGEVFGDKIWWNNLRPVHAILYGLFGYLAYNKSKDSYKLLMADVIIGLVSFIDYHFTNIIF